MSFSVLRHCIICPACLLSNSSLAPVGTLAGIRDTEAALLGLKRQRLLQELDALHGGSDHQLELQGEQAGQAVTAVEAAAAAGVGSRPAAQLQPGATCIFRQTDGRHYWGRVLESAGDSVSVQPLFPTRQVALTTVCRYLACGTLRP